MTKPYAVDRNSNSSANSRAAPVLTLNCSSNKSDWDHPTMEGLRKERIWIENDNTHGEKSVNGATAARKAERDELSAKAIISNAPLRGCPCRVTASVLQEIHAVPQFLAALQLTGVELLGVPCFDGPSVPWLALREEWNVVGVSYSSLCTVALPWRSYVCMHSALR